jgi:replicative DNA helicase
VKLAAVNSEIAALRGCCIKNKVVGGTLLAGLDVDYFHYDFTKETYKSILRLTKETGEVPKWRDILDTPALPEKTRDRLKKASPERISTVQEAHSVLKTLNEYRQLRGCYDLSTAIVNSLRKPSADVGEVIETISNQVVQLRQTKSNENAIVTFGKGNNAGRLVKSLLDKKKANFVPTGFTDFDKENGGIFYGSLFTIGATSGGGKSATASQLAMNWAGMGETVCIVPLEMTEEEQAARVMANASGLDTRKILLQKLSENEQAKYLRSYRKMALRFKKAGGSYSIFKPKQDMTIEDIMASIHPLDPSIVIVDYISLLKGVDGDDAWQKLGQVARYCKIWAENHKKIVVLLCQVSEEGKIRYAQSIKEHSNNCWIFVATKQTRENEIINVNQLKARNGRLFDFTLSAKLDTMRIGDLDVEEREKYINKMRTDVKPEEGRKKKKDKDRKGKDRDRSDGENKARKKAAVEYLSDMADGDDD